MRLLIFGNSGSGKSHYAQRLSTAHGLPHLDLDTLVWEPGQIAVLRSEAALVADLEGFTNRHAAWVIEGCYGDLIQRLLPSCSELIFMNPGLDACLANNRHRPWEPHKYETHEAQEDMLPALLDWVADYYVRGGTWSFSHHRQLFDGHGGTKREVTEQE